MRIKYLLLPLLCFIVFSGYSQKLPTTTQQDFTIEIPDIIVTDVTHHLTIKLTDSDNFVYFEKKIVPIVVNGKSDSIVFHNGKAIVDMQFSSNDEYNITSSLFTFSGKVDAIPLWMSVLPPLIAILMALLFKEVFSALFTGLLVGTSIIYFYKGNMIFVAIMKGVFAIADEYIINALYSQGHLSIIVFSMLIGGTVNLITRNGGMKGVVNKLSRYAKSSQSGQFVTWLLGIAIFFDDYANTLVVGNTMRPVTDKLKISRAKLAYIVDSTAAPIAAIAFVTTWIGAELSYIQDGINTIGLDDSPYSIFLNSLSYCFYPVFALLFIPILIWKKRDFGPMYKAEIKARNSDAVSGNEEDGFSNNLNELDIDDSIKARWYNAVIPVVVIIVGTLAGLFYTGWDNAVWDSDLSFAKKLSETIGAADSYRALLWSSLSGVIVAVIMTQVQKIMSLKEAVDSLINGFRTMLTAIVILILAWSIARVTEDMHTASFISNILLQTQMSPYLVPALTFVMAALVAFSTGSSWGTMAILYPLILPASWLIAQKSGLSTHQSYDIFYNVVSTVLAGSVLGDHCSPISDTTILSSLASSCNHIEHVRTQLPYALVVGLVSIIAGVIPSAYGVPVWILFPLGLVLLYLIVIFVGRKTDNECSC